MTTGIFIKTWIRDLPWLEYCIQSIKKYAIGITEVVIVGDKPCGPELSKYAGVFGTMNIKVCLVDEWSNGYIQQQYVKLNADHFIATDNILFVDSDCIFHDYFSENSFMLGRMPILLKTRYGILGSGDAWKPITEKALGWTVDWEYMAADFR